MSVSRELKRQVQRYDPCLPRPAKSPPSGPGWIHEIKHDGFRIIAELDGGDTGWVCEAHHDRPWGEPNGCTCGGAGMPCPRCNRTDKNEQPDVSRTLKVIVDKDGYRH